MAKKEMDAGDKSEYYVEFSKPYVFEGEEFTGVDLSGLDGLSMKDLLQVERAWTLKNNASRMIEMNMAFALETAAVVTGKPFEFFEGLPKRDGLAVKDVVQRDFFGLMG